MECVRRAFGKATTPVPSAVLPITLLLRFYVARNTASQWIGGLWGYYCMRCWQAVAPSILLARLKIQTRTPRISYFKLFWRRPYVYRDPYPLRLRLSLKDFFARIQRKDWVVERGHLVFSILLLILSLKRSIGKWYCPDVNVKVYVFIKVRILLTTFFNRSWSRNKLHRLTNHVWIPIAISRTSRPNSQMRKSV